MYFTMQEEYENKISFLDITISEDDNKIRFIIYRKTTASDIIIPKDSCQTPEHKLSATNYLTNLLSTQPINEKEKRKKVTR